MATKTLFTRLNGQCYYYSRAKNDLTTATNILECIVQVFDDGLALLMLFWLFDPIGFAVRLDFQYFT